MAGNFLYNQKQPSAGEGEVANFREFLEKSTTFNEHPVLDNCLLFYRKIRLNLSTGKWEETPAAIKTEINDYCHGTKTEVGKNYRVSLE